ncbi:MAG: restriction endonuclease subunit S [Fibrobacter sp.]|nr:restriction endonuclease subunit S [Fibrobacter sp.]
MRKMKNSGVDWIGQIPSDWDVTRIGYESWIRARLGWKGLKAEEYVDEGFAFLSAFNIVDDKLQWENLNFINQQRYDESPEIKLKKGDILLVKDGAGIGKCARIDSLPIGAATTNGSLAVISTHAKLSYRYLYFYLLSPIFQNYIYRLMNGMGVPHLSQEELRKIQIPFPPIDEQKKIADFLDEKCGEIDSIRSDIQKQIDILNDYKKSVITEAVTKGLNPKAKLKDSGIEWIGKIPEGWDVKRFKYIADALYKGNGITKEQVFLDGNTQCVRYGEIYSKYNISFSDCLSLTKCELISPPQYFEYGDILFAGTGELVEEIGKNIVYLGNEKCLAGGDIVVARHSQNPSFLNYALGSSYCQSQKSSGKAKLKVVHISATQIGNILVAIPPLPEQKAIADYLDEKCSEIDATIADKQKQLEILDEYKKSLIFEYVTGKKEVP